MKRTKEHREFVAFITVETGDDLIVSFGVCPPDDPADIESLMILRTPKYESFLEEWERGAAVSFARDRKSDEEVVLLREVFYAPDGKFITLRTDHQTYQLDVGKVDPSELSAMCGAFQKMNFDSSIRLTGV